MLRVRGPPAPPPTHPGPAWQVSDLERVAAGQASTVIVMLPDSEDDAEGGGGGGGVITLDSRQVRQHAFVVGLTRGPGLCTQASGANGSRPLRMTKERHAR